MQKYRDALPQLAGRLFITDGGMETTLVFHDGIDLPYFAAFDLLKSEDGINRLRDYYRRYAAIATANRVGFVLESVTWRASSDWGRLMGHSDSALEAINHLSIHLLEELREELETEESPMVISGCIGPRGDGYNPDAFMTADEAQAYHAQQIRTLSASAADMISAMTMTYAEEVTGMVRAAQAENIPIVISFTLETDGRLPSGQSLQEAIEQVDADTGSGPAYYMINCAHPEHFEDTLTADEPWLQRIKGIRANASRKSHAELDECEVLDDGDPHELGQSYQQFSKKLKQLNVFGGCCGTDHRHVAAICRSVTNSC
jgi:S-methylmethionine-dependent homocysteine/selenocysteine methylase